MFAKTPGSARFARPRFQELRKGSNTNILNVLDIRPLGTDFLNKLHRFRMMQFDTMFFM